MENKIGLSINNFFQKHPVGTNTAQYIAADQKYLALAPLRVMTTGHKRSLTVFPSFLLLSQYILVYVEYTNLLFGE